MTTLNLQSSFRLLVTMPYPYYETFQATIRKVGIKEEEIKDINENLCQFSIVCANLQEAALIDSLYNRIVK